VILSQRNRVFVTIAVAISVGVLCRIRTVPCQYPWRTAQVHQRAQRRALQNGPSSNLEIKASPLDNYQRKAALEMIHEAKRPLLFVYHPWLAKTTPLSSDVCRFEHFPRQCFPVLLNSPDERSMSLGVLRGVGAARPLTVPGPEIFYLLEPQVRRRRDRRGEQLACRPSKNSRSSPVKPGKDYHPHRAARAFFWRVSIGE